MGLIKLDYHQSKVENSTVDALSIPDFHSFNPQILDLGDISKEGKYQEAIAAVFDLEGFTSFCNQIDPHLVIADYLKVFLAWLFHEIAKEFTVSENQTEVQLWSRLPFFAKFLGDGVLFLWDTSSMGHSEFGNVVVSLKNISDTYTEKLLPAVKKSVSKAPAKLRCGIARGQIISVGEGRDFVGACINVATRIQKLPHFSFAFSKRGFNLKKCFSKKNAEKIMLIKAPIRGIGEEELICVWKREFDLLSQEEQQKLIP